MHAQHNTTIAKAEKVTLLNKQLEGKRAAPSVCAKGGHVSCFCTEQQHTKPDKESQAGQTVLTLFSQEEFLKAEGGQALEWALKEREKERESVV